MKQIPSVDSMKGRPARKLYIMRDSIIDLILQRAITDIAFRRLLFFKKTQVLKEYSLNEGERAYLNAFTPEKFHTMIGGMITHRLMPVRIAERFMIIPESYNSVPLPGDINILLNTGWAFGNGTHATTELSLAALSQFLHPGETVLDLGTGTGILAIAAARLGAACVNAYDVDVPSVKSARRNIELNQVGGIVRVEPGTLQEAQKINRHGWDLVIVNILTPVFLNMLGDGLGRTLHTRSRLIVSAIKPKELVTVQNALARHGLSLLHTMQLRSWYTLIALKPDANDNQE